MNSNSCTCRLHQTAPIKLCARHDSCVKHHARTNARTHARTHLAHLGKRARREFCSKKKKKKKRKLHSLLSVFSLCQEVLGAPERKRSAAAWTRSPERREGDAGTESSADACGGSERETEREAERQEARSGLTVQR